MSDAALDTHLMGLPFSLAHVKTEVELFLFEEPSDASVPMFMLPTSSVLLFFY